MKKFAAIVCIFILLLTFSGCSGASYYKSDSNYAPQMEAGEDYVNEYSEAEAMPEESFNSVASNPSPSTQSVDGQPFGGRKLIRNVNLEVETLEFDTFIETIKNKVASYGGYLESSSISGNSINYDSTRYANLICRVPSAKLDEFVNTVDGLGNVTYSYEDTTDVTLTYVDIESRVKSLETEYDRLLELLAEADNIESIVTIEARLSEVRYELESYKSQLRTYDNMVDYSTVSVSVSEVKRITQTEQITVWQRISADFGDNVYDIWIGLQDFFVWFVANIPYFLLLAAVVIVIILIIRLVLRNNKKYQEKRVAKKAEKERRKAAKLAKKNPVAVPEEPSSEEKASENEEEK